MGDAIVEALRAQLSQQVVVGAITLGLIGVVAASLRHLPVALWSQLKRLFIVSATLDSRNDLFPAFVAWMDEQPFGRTSRLFTVIQASPALELEDDSADTPPLQYSPAPGFHVFWLRGRLCWMQREIAMNLQVVETIHLSALFASRRRLEDILEAVRRHASERRAHLLAIYTVDRWGEQWQLSDTKPRRPLDSVVLDAGVAQKLRADLETFFTRRNWYARMGIPWRRGYLLHGPPGTGKTSLAYALAGELKLKLCTLSLTNPKLNDHVLADLLQRTPPRSLILIEDVDAFFRGREAQHAKIEVSFSGLLNALDGVGAQEGRVVVLTTNHRDRLDAALLRPGRIDVDIELGLTTPDQLRGLVDRFHPEAPAEVEALAEAYRAALAADPRARRLSPAEVQQALIAHPTLAAATRAMHEGWQRPHDAAPPPPNTRSA